MGRIELSCSATVGMRELSASTKNASRKGEEIISSLFALYLSGLAGRRGKVIYGNISAKTTCPIATYTTRGLNGSAVSCVHSPVKLKERRSISPRPLRRGRELAVELLSND